MQVAQVTIQELLGGNVQFMVPLFQREYSWEKKDWDTLWEDLTGWIEDRSKEPHFLGSIVVISNESVEVSFPRYSLIDGQQRITTFMLLLAALRDIARAHSGNEAISNRAEQINNQFLTNQYEAGNDKFTLLPTQPDRKYYQSVILPSVTTPKDKSHGIVKCYDFFIKKIKSSNIDVNQILHGIINGMALVKISLNQQDNPYAVFESLNAKGQPLSQSDLIRNYVLMKVADSQQTSSMTSDQIEARQNLMYDEYWLPMERALTTEELPEFIRHFIVRTGGKVNKKDVFQSFRMKYSSGEHVSNTLKSMYECSKFYRKLIQPDLDLSAAHNLLLYWINGSDMGVFYPIFLLTEELVRQDILQEEDHIIVLKTILNLNIRRFLTGMPTNQYRSLVDKMASTLYLDQSKNGLKNSLTYLRELEYHSDPIFIDKCKLQSCFGGGSTKKSKVIIEILEYYESNGKNLPVKGSNLFQLYQDQNIGIANEPEEAQENRFLNNHGQRIGNLFINDLQKEIGFNNIEDLALTKSTLNRKFLEKYSKVDTETIEDRSYYMAKMIVECLPNIFTSEDPMPLL